MNKRFKKTAAVWTAVILILLTFCTAVSAGEISGADRQLLSAAILMKFDRDVSFPVMNAYAAMILNRTKDSRFPDSIADVILSLGYRGNIAALPANVSEKTLRMAQDAATNALLGIDASNGALWCVTEEEAAVSIGKIRTFAADGCVFLR